MVTKWPWKNGLLSSKAHQIIIIIIMVSLSDLKCTPLQLYELNDELLRSVVLILVHKQRIEILMLMTKFTSHWSLLASSSQIEIKLGKLFLFILVYFFIHCFFLFISIFPTCHAINLPELRLQLIKTTIIIIIIKVFSPLNYRNPDDTTSFQGRSFLKPSGCILCFALGFLHLELHLKIHYLTSFKYLQATSMLLFI